MVKPNTTQPLIIQLSNGQVITSDDVLKEFGESSFDYQTGRWKIPIPQLKHHFEQKAKTQQQVAGKRQQAAHALGAAHPHHLLSLLGQRRASPVQSAPHPLLQHFKHSQQRAPTYQGAPKPMMPAGKPQHPLIAKFRQTQQAGKPKGLLSKLAGLFKKDK